MQVNNNNIVDLITATPKAFNVDNPVQAKRSSGYEDTHFSPELRRSSTNGYEPFTESFGMWKNYDIDVKTIRKQVWKTEERLEL